MSFQQYNFNSQLSPCRVLSTSAQSGTYYNGANNNGVGATFTYATGTLTIDSVAVVSGDSVALTAQSSGFQNGIYVCTQTGATGVSAILQRRNDFQSIEQLKEGQWTTFGAGTVHAGAMVCLTEPMPGAIGVDSIVLTPVVPAGLGTASTRAASDVAQTNVASVSGATVAGNLASYYDTAGTIQDGGLNLRMATVAITAAQFNGMYAAPKLLLAAQGANTLIVIHKVELLMTYVAAAYAAGGVAAVQYDSTANGAGVIASTTLSAATFQAAASTGFVFNNGVVPATFSTCVNKGLYLSNVTGAFTTGDSTFVAKVFYSVLPTV